MNLENKILSDIIIYSKYAKYDKTLKRRESWEEICDRNMLMHMKKYPTLKKQIKQIYDDFIKTKKVLPSMRSLQFGGKAIEVNEARLYNCSYMSASHIRFFPELMFLLLGGSGVGYSVQTHHIEQLPPIQNPLKLRKFVIEDSIAGWADSIKALFKSYMQGTSKPKFDYTQIRPKGTELITAGGQAPGPAPLKICLTKIDNILENANGRKLKSIEVHEIACHVADAVLSGGVRRAACISFFSADDYDMLTCKSGNWWELHPEFARANNSVVLERGIITYQQFKDLWDRVKESGSGEPGFVWTNNKEVLGNPCFGGKERLLTAEGYKTFEELCDIGPIEIRNKNGNITESKVWCSGEKETIKFIDKNNNETICTPDHVWMLLDGTECKAIDLKGKIIKLASKNGILIKDVIPHKKIKVYDFTEPETHWGVVNGYIAHNCFEISLKDRGLCNLTSINVSDIESQEDFEERCYVAGFLGTLQAGYTDFYYLRDSWKDRAEKEALLGVSMTGIASNKLKDINIKSGANKVIQVNEAIANIIGINKAKRLTCIKPEGTASIVLGTSSGIHAYHAPFYIRRVRLDKSEAIYGYLIKVLPELIEDDYFRPQDTAVLSIPQKSPDNAIFRGETAIDLLERSKSLYQDWVVPGHIEGDNTHNISITVSIKDNEWEIVGEWMWANKNHYNGISVLNYDGGTYKQPPFEECSEDKYNLLKSYLKEIDLTQIIEDKDFTNLSGELACSGGNCEV